MNGSQFGVIIASCPLTNVKSSISVFHPVKPTCLYLNAA